MIFMANSAHARHSLSSAIVNLLFANLQSTQRCDDKQTNQLVAQFLHTEFNSLYVMGDNEYAAGS